MTHLHEGNYAGKHSAHQHLDTKISAALKPSIMDGKLSCSNANNVANTLGVNLADVGVTADLLEAKINKCMLGLFGYNTESPHGKRVKSSDSVSKELRSAILSASEDSHISCISAWAIADRLGVSKMSVTSACDTLKVKISTCQLGAF